MSANTHRLALIVSCLGAVAAAAFAWGVLDGLPHLEDEVAYLFQARVFALGRLSVDPLEPRCAFWLPFVVEVGGQRFGKYPPGWPALLSLGVVAGAPWLVNPLLGGLTLYLVYHIGREMVGGRVGLLAAGLGATSPLYLSLSGSLMPHASAACFFALFCLAFLRARRIESLRWALLAGVSLGTVFLIRPLTAVGLGVPFALYELIQAVRHRRPAWRRWLAMALAGTAIAALSLLFTWAVAGSPTANPYLLVWPNDRVGFGPQVGPGGHTVLDALSNVGTVLLFTGRDLLGWAWLSWIGVLLALVLPPRSRWDVGLTVPFAGLALAYTLYWYSGVVPLGPRYQYEGAILLWLLTAVGVSKLDRHLGPRGRRVALAVIALLLLSNLLVVLPSRIYALHGLYGVTRAWFRPVEQADLHQALVVCEGEEWRACRTMYGRMDPLAQADVVYAYSCNPSTDAALVELLPDRAVYRFDGQTLRPGP